MAFKIKREILTFLYLSLGLVLFVHNSQSIKFGEPCNFSDEYPNSEENVYDYCDIVKGGGCINGICQCQQSNSMVYNERLSECGIPTGLYCEDEFSCLSGNLCKNNTCVCPAFADSLADGGCTGFRFDFCRRDTECNAGQFLGCNGGVCDCLQKNRTVFEYATQNSTEGCKVRAGESCTMEIKSQPQNQPITNQLHQPTNQQCVSNSVCTTTTTSAKGWTCQCNDGYSAISHGFCKKNYGQQCDTYWNECNSISGLTCVNGTCACDEVHSEVHYDISKDSCISYVGELCGHFPTLIDNYDYDVVIQCVENAECVDNYLFLSKVCECGIGYVANQIDGKTCVLDDKLFRVVKNVNDVM